MGLILALAFGLFTLLMLFAGWRIRDQSSKISITSWFWWLMTLLLFVFLGMQICGPGHINPNDYYF
jgi:hypothetical protein